MVQRLQSLMVKFIPNSNKFLLKFKISPWPFGWISNGWKFEEYGGTQLLLFVRWEEFGDKYQAILDGDP